jgi:hypothetical protein
MTRFIVNLQDERAPTLAVARAQNVDADAGMYIRRDDGRDEKTENGKGRLS